MPSTDIHAIEIALGGRDPETLLGPILWLLTRLANMPVTENMAEGDNVRTSLVGHLCALASHGAVPFEVRLVAGALAIEHRGDITNCRQRMVHT